MAHLTKVSRDCIILMQGCEVQSLDYEGVVYVRGNDIYQDGEIIGVLDTDEKVADLWNEYLENEGIR